MMKTTRINQKSIFTAAILVSALSSPMAALEPSGDSLVIPNGVTTTLPPGRFTGQISVGRSATLHAEGAIIENIAGRPAVILHNGARIVGGSVVSNDSSPVGAAIHIRAGRGFIEDCVVSGGAGAGILVLRGSLELRSSTVKYSRIGVVGRRAEVLISLSSIHSNFGPGVDMEEESRLQMDNSTVAENRGDGILLGAGCRAEIETSTISNNGGFGLRELFPNSMTHAVNVRAEENANGLWLRHARELRDTFVAMTGSSSVSSNPTPSTTAPREEIDNISVDPVEFLLSQIDFAAADMSLPGNRLDSTQRLVIQSLDSPLHTGSELKRFALEFASEQNIALKIAALLRISDSLEISPPETLLLEDAFAGAAAVIASSHASDEILDAVISNGPSLTLFEEHVMGEEIREESRRLGRLAAEIRVNPITEHAIRLLNTVMRMAADTGFGQPRTAAEAPDFIEGGYLVADSTPYGWYIIGSENGNVYHLAGQKIALLIDPGGDDEYEFAANAESCISVVLDIEGNDRYAGRTAAAKNGIAILVDLEGDDLYFGDDFTQASASGGFALLWDRGGNDRYIARQFGQGAAVAGIAILIDESGDDDFAMASHGQAFAGPHGTALLFDAEGADRYSLRGGPSDDLRTVPQSLSYGQGFSAGLRPYGSGGVALLIDERGNDNYQAGLFAQGASYWGALGALIDGDGNDVYRAWQYAQGTGVHISSGFLIDRGSGMDLYYTWGVAQGCGHDLALGYLEDEGGSDLYQAYSRAQGMGMSNGVGIFLDHGGDDRYLLNRLEDGQGAGQFEPSVRRYGSLGLFYDGAGTDLYTRSGADSAVWIQGDVGIGWDRGSGLDILTFDKSPEIAIRSVEINDLARNVKMSSPDPLEYLLALSTGKSAYRGLAEFSLAQLSDAGDEAIAFLAERADPADPREWEILRKIAGRRGTDAGKALARLLASSDTHPRTAMILVAIGTSRDEGSAEIVAEYLGHEDTRIRRAAALALGEIAAPGSADSIALRSEDPDPNVRRLAVDALRKIDSDRARWLKLIFRNDTDAWVRRSAVLE